MEIYLAILRQNHCDSNIKRANEYNISSYQIFTISGNLDNDSNFIKLPSFFINTKNPNLEIYTILDKLVDKDPNILLIGKRIFCISSSTNKPPLYCVIVTDHVDNINECDKFMTICDGPRGCVEQEGGFICDCKTGFHFDKNEEDCLVSSKFMPKAVKPQKIMSFYNIEDVRNFSYIDQLSKCYINQLINWLNCLYQIQGLLHLLFSTITEERLSWSILNPMHSSNTMQRTSLLYFHKCRLSSKIFNIDKCSLTIINPTLLLHHTNPLEKVNLAIINEHWGLLIPNYSLLHLNFLSNQNMPAFLSGSVGSKLGKIINLYPLHEAAKNGTAGSIIKLLKMGYLPQQKDSYLSTPLHYAVQYGNVEAIQIFLNIEQFDPNILNGNKQTALHIAALEKQLKSAEVLLTNKNTDINILDKNNRTPLELVETMNPSNKFAQLFKTILERSDGPIIRIFLMNGTCRYVNLTCNIKTTANQLLLQIRKMLGIPVKNSRLFAIWVCSKSLQLQLHQEHRPIEYIENWGNYFTNLTGMDSQHEIPELFLKRNAEIALEEEKKVEDATTQYLLYIEAYHNYIQSLYPCSEVDAIMLAAILLLINKGSIHIKKTSLFKEEELRDYIPLSMLLSHGLSYWNECIMEQLQGLLTHFKDFSIEALHGNFLFIARNLTTYGSAFFTGYAPTKGKVPTAAYLAVNDIGLHIISVQSRKMWRSFEYGKIVWKVEVHKDQFFLEINSKLKNHNQSTYIKTNQAGLIDNLMKRFQSSKKKII